MKTYSPITRFRRRIVLRFLVLVSILLGILSWVTLREPSRLIRSELERKGILASNNLAQYSRAGLLVKDQEFLQDLVISVKQTDPDILSAAFYGYDGHLLVTTDPDRPFPIHFNLEDLPELRILRSADTMAVMNPVRDDLGRTLGLTLVELSQGRVKDVVHKSALFIVLTTLGFFFGVFIILNFLIKEALKASQLEQAYDRLQRLQEQLVKSERLAAIGQLAASVAHEIRNPLSGIQNAIYYLRDALKDSPIVTQDPAINDMIALAEDEIRVSTCILNELLDYSRPVKLEIYPQSIPGLVQASLNSLNVPGTIKTSFHYSSEAENLLCDYEKMKQVFQNLIMNAIQAMSGQGELTISTRLEKSAENGSSCVCVEVKDTGSGIKPENMPRLFEPLFSTKAKGTGLGLSISREIVEKHGGKIEVRSEESLGSIFIVKIPAS